MSQGSSVYPYNYHRVTRAAELSQLNLPARVVNHGAAGVAGEGTQAGEPLAAGRTHVVLVQHDLDRLRHDPLLLYLQRRHGSVFLVILSLFLYLAFSFSFSLFL